MNNPSPFVPQGSLTEQKNKSRARVLMIVSVIIGANVILLMGMLVQGCRKPAESEAGSPTPEATNAAATPTFDSNAVPTVDTNAPATNATPYVAPTVVDTNPPPPPPSAGQDYTIEKGDTFAILAKKFGVAVKAIEDANPGVDPKKLKIKQVVHIPAAAAVAPGASAATSTTDSTASEQTYKVKSGDTLTSIAKHFGITVKALRSENSLTTDKIKVGQALKIPAKTAAAPSTAKTQ